MGIAMIVRWLLLLAATLQGYAVIYAQTPQWIKSSSIPSSPYTTLSPLKDLRENTPDSMPPIFTPVTSVPFASPPSNLPQNLREIHTFVRRYQLPNSHQMNIHDAISLTSLPMVGPSVPVISALSNLDQNSQEYFPIIDVEPPIFSSASPSQFSIPRSTGQISPSPSSTGAPHRSTKNCVSIICTEELTYSPPESPCGCVRPMQVGLQFSVELLTFFSLVPELEVEIANGVFMKQSQIRIIGANTATQQPDKTVVLLDLVPLGQNFDYITVFLTYQRLWRKQVIINPFFGDYEVLYVNYPGLPQLPPMAPSNISIEDDGPYSQHGSNGRIIQPLGVDVRRNHHKNGLHSGIIAIVVVSISIVIVLCVTAVLVLFLKRGDLVCQAVQSPEDFQPCLARPEGTAGSRLGSGQSNGLQSYGSSIVTCTGIAKTFSLSDIERATDEFNPLRVLGEGGFGRVYDGVLEDGTKVAIKVLKRDDHQGDREFLAEVEMLSRLHHRNLVKLIGICAEERARCLVYELVPNGSVESHLHGIDKETDPLDWNARIKIALGAARGLAYLHEDSIPRVIHRDFKSSNILLDYNFMPKVSDFGLARAGLDEENTHISTRVMGTFGYVAPEYAMTGHLLVKSDVYSYGVVLLELLTGRKPVDMAQPPGQENLVSWARPLLISRQGLEIITDPFICCPFDNVSKVAAIASMCVQPEVSHRPFMGEVVQALKLVCNECDHQSDSGMGEGSESDISIYEEARYYNSGSDVEMGLSVLDFLDRPGMVESFRRHSSSGPLRTDRLWKAMRRLSGGSVSDRVVGMFKSCSASH